MPSFCKQRKMQCESGSILPLPTIKFLFQPSPGYDSTSSWIPRQETARGSRNFFPALLAKRFAPLALGSRCVGRNGRPNTRHFFRRRRSSESHASLSEPEVQTESRNKEIRSRRTFYTGEQAMDNMAIPYSAAALPLSIHAVET